MQPSIRREVSEVLASWPFVVSLATLIANDCWLKASYPGVITGKLSDFAGIAMIGVLALARFPSRPAVVCAAIAAAFAWWKSELSQPLIDVVNDISPIAIGRTVDYGDLWALLVMPGCLVMARRAGEFKLLGEAARRLMRVPLIAVTAFAVLATSMRPTMMQHEVRSFHTSAKLDRDAISRAFEELAKARDLECFNCIDPKVSASYTHGRNGLHLEYRFVDDFSLSIQSSVIPNGPKGVKKLDELALQIKRRLREIQPGLEFTERIVDQ